MRLRGLLNIWIGILVLIPQANAQILGTPTADGLASLSFLEGHWRGDNDGLVFEEIWSNEGGGVVSAMARGVRDGRLSALEYILVEDTPQGPVMRFKHFYADYSNWDGEDTPITLYLGKNVENDVSFINADANAIVQGVRYFLTPSGQLQTDVTLLREGVTDRFTLLFDRVSIASE